MIKNRILFAFIITILCTNYAFAKSYPLSQINRVISTIHSSAVYATIKYDTDMYKEASSSSLIAFSIGEGCMVEIIKDKTSKWYYVRDNIDSMEGWVKGDCLYFPDDKPTNKIKMHKDDIECFANSMPFKSKSAYFVWTDIDRQVVHVFRGKEKNWALLKSLSCSTGKNTSPTIRGLFTISERGLWFYSERLKSGGKYWVRFKDSYLFHSVAMDKNKNIIDPIISERRSSGCIRFAVQDAKWFYENVPDTTTVFIY